MRARGKSRMFPARWVGCLGVRAWDLWFRVWGKRLPRSMRQIQGREGRGGGGWEEVDLGPALVEHRARVLRVEGEELLRVHPLLRVPVALQRGHQRRQRVGRQGLPHRSRSVRLNCPTPHLRVSSQGSTSRHYALCVRFAQLSRGVQQARRQSATGSRSVPATSSPSCSSVSFRPEGCSLLLEYDGTPP